MFNVGVISDTHGFLRPEAIAVLRGSDYILHAGDIGSPEILDELRTIAPVTAIRGNIDIESWATKISVTDMLELGGKFFYLIHDRAALDLKPKAAGIAAVIFGHTHQPLIETRDGILYFNPGSAGPRRFKLPISVGRIQIDDKGALHPELIPLLA